MMVTLILGPPPHDIVFCMALGAAHKLLTLNREGGVEACDAKPVNKYKPSAMCVAIETFYKHTGWPINFKTVSVNLYSFTR